MESIVSSDLVKKWEWIAVEDCVPPVSLIASVNCSKPNRTYNSIIRQKCIFFSFIVVCNQSFTV